MDSTAACGTIPIRECDSYLVLKTFGSILIPRAAIFLYLEEKYRKTHEFSDEQFMKILGKIPEECKHYNFPRLLLLTKFWSKFYETAKYGNEKLGVGPEKLFKEKEAKMALEHANECYYAVSGIRSWIYRTRARAT